MKIGDKVRNHWGQCGWVVQVGDMVCSIELAVNTKTFCSPETERPLVIEEVKKVLIGWGYWMGYKQDEIYISYGEAL